MCVSVSVFYVAVAVHVLTHPQPGDVVLRYLHGLLSII